MDILHTCCCGLDVHKETVVACLIHPAAQAQRELRDLTRTRTTLTDERSAAVCRLQKVLEDANLKLAGVATDILGVSGRAILQALVEGNTDPATLADLAKGRLRRKRAVLKQALDGRL